MDDRYFLNGLKNKIQTFLIQLNTSAAFIVSVQRFTKNLCKAIEKGPALDLKSSRFSLGLHKYQPENKQKQDHKNQKRDNPPYFMHIRGILPCLSAGAIADMSPLIKLMLIIPSHPTTGTV